MNAIFFMFIVRKCNIYRFHSIVIHMKRIPSLCKSCFVVYEMMPYNDIPKKKFVGRLLASYTCLSPQTSNPRKSTHVQFSPSLHRSSRTCVFGFFFAYSFFENMRLCLFCIILLLRFLRLCFLCCVFFLRSHINWCRSRSISFASLPCYMPLAIIKIQNNLLNTFFKRQSEYFL